MKKIFFVILILILATLCFASCAEIGEYAKLNQISKNNYSQVRVDITVQKSGEQSKLVSNIVCINVDQTTQTVAYVLQEYAKIGVEGDTITLPDQQIVTKSGTVTLQNGVVTSQQGDQTTFDFANMGKLRFTFRDSYLANARTENGIFSAYVTNTTGFFGQSISGATNVKVAVDVNTYKSITISYTANGSDVTIVYTLA